MRLFGKKIFFKLQFSRPWWSRGNVTPRDPRFVGSNPAEFDGFFQDVKILSTGPLGGTLS